MELALASSGHCGLAPRRPAARRASRARGPMVRSVLEINKPANTANGAGKVDLAGEVANELKYRLAAPKADTDKLYQSVAWSVHNRLVDAFDKTHEHWNKEDPKHVYYLSAEFLMGRTLTNAVHNMGLQGDYAEALKQFGQTLEGVHGAETDAALGNGGLGRLAACFLDSMATLDLPGWGYGIRYRYGMFRQAIKDGLQVELPDYWLDNGNPWEIRRPETRFNVGFYGKLEGDKWVPGEEVIAEAYDVPIPGYGTKTCSNLRLWDALPLVELDLDAFNAGQYEKAVEQKRKADDIAAVLYPNDATEYGKELRLKQQFFFVSASLQDTIARYLEKHSDLAGLPEKACFQMNDTHPTIAVAELMRLLIDVHGLPYDKAWAITTKSLAYTNHTVMPEALEKWPVAVMQKLLPRHMQLIEQINDAWLASVKDHSASKGAQLQAAKKAEREAAAAAAKEERAKAAAAALEAATTPEEKAAAEAAAKKAEEEAEAALKAILEEDAKVDYVAEVLKSYSIIQENQWNKGEMLVNMAYLAVVGSFAVNGVAAIHSEIIKTDIFPQFVELTPEKFQNKTNGVTLRRWLAYCNPELSALITEALGTDAWVKDATLLAGLKPFAEDAAFRKRWRDVKFAKKAALAKHIKEVTGYEVSTQPLFDVQVKRIHEYKRQFMNAISIIYRYKKIKEMSPEERKKVVPRVCIFGGKAASAYYMAKKIVALVVAIAAKVNNDPEVGDLLKVVFLPNYNVSEAEVIIPAAELSQHISTAGTEASGTSNMKFALNGSFIIGTMDGANIEIGENTGFENLFIFGVQAEEINRLREERKDFKDYDPRWTEALEWVKAGAFGRADYFDDLVASVNDMTRGNDWFLLANDFASYMDAQDEVDKLYRDQEEWTRRSILYTAGNGFFSSDRTIDQYAKEIWSVQPCRQA
ncbi:Alpha-glucan phosphorylase cytosolic [Chlorella sorokiniana]|uniref:Alpha-1,4 glucan phosphorylase n=1 Tax=Chlorella sorokiniana TaxID=3076 RepID=A0A2P6U3Z2_CHLSO|nr:Alpha-glucan phosphorylase cytosolic [Chlorella sorokiniana]|eukprot:PRW61019.1 Alpha-glucan phosphorylase cytosolic [Chlorella sorokiniana]